MTSANADTLQLDTVLLNDLRADSRYDYDRELMEGGQSLTEWLAEQMSQFVRRMLGDALGNDVTTYVLVVVGAAVVAYLGWKTWRHRPALFRHDEKEAPLDYTLHEDTIYGIDFDTQIDEALDHANYRQAVRLLYLQTLRRLSDNGRIDWQPYKTPTQYIYEVDDVAFTQMSGHFIRVRYGNFEATRTLFDEMSRLRETLQKGGGTA